MANKSQVNIQRVSRRLDREIRTAFVDIASALKHAYDDTAQQLEAWDFHPRIGKASFGSILFFNAQNRLYHLNSTSPIFDVSLMPNGAYGAQHITIEIARHWFITVSAVTNEQALPRGAQFRDRYALQHSFGIDENNNLVPLPLRVPDEPEPTYLQLLHGSLPDNRRKLGFIKVARPNASGEYSEEPIPLAAFLNEDTSRIHQTWRRLKRIST